MKIRLHDNKFYTTETPICQDCKESCEKMCYEFAEFGRHKSRVSIYCQRCIGKQKATARISQIKPVMIIDKWPDGSHRTITHAPGLVQRADLTVFSAVSDKAAPAAQVVDHTRLGGRDSLEGARIGRQPVEDKPTLKNREEVHGFLSALQNSTPMLGEHEQRKQIEADKKLRRAKA